MYWVMSEHPNPARYIRERIFGVDTQTEFADLLGYEQATISRFESGRRYSAEAQERIRALARERKIKFDNNLFWEVPEHQEGRSEDRSAA
jgi:transcriptional regulator with XRE-family HTH domain